MNDVAVLEPVAPPTATELENDEHYEIIDGQRVELPPMSAFDSRLASRLVSDLNAHARSRGLGEAVMETLVHLPLPVDRNRRPDVAFISSQRWPKDRPQPRRDNAWEVVPDLAVEIVSPTDYVEDLLVKVDEFFRAGVRLVWVICPTLGLVYVYESLTQVRGLTRNEELDGGPVLPDFRLPLADLFPPATPAS